VFVVATANDVSRLPPEFLRKGRFDETSSSTCPMRQPAPRSCASTCASAAGPDALDLDLVTTATRGFSGAEIEQVVVSALYTAFSDGGAAHH
jgi:SpoVK/Ycf46/Vps4 family AAA+-type ATPase